MEKLFVYGTLQLQELFTAVTGQPFPKSCQARLHGYQIYRVKLANYPAAVPEPGISVNGLLLDGLSQQLLKVLDTYEDTAYLRTSAEVETHNGCQQAYFYLFRESARSRLSSEIWSLENYREEILQDLENL